MALNRVPYPLGMALPSVKHDPFSVGVNGLTEYKLKIASKRGLIFAPVFRETKNNDTALFFVKNF